MGLLATLTLLDQSLIEEMVTELRLPLRIDAEQLADWLEKSPEHKKRLILLHSIPQSVLVELYQHGDKDLQEAIRKTGKLPEKVVNTFSCLKGSSLVIDSSMISAFSDNPDSDAEHNLFRKAIED